MYAFRTNYHFSKTLFILDTAAVSLRDGKREGIFLKDPPVEVEIDPSLTLAEDVALTSPRPATAAIANTLFENMLYPPQGL